MSQIQKRKYYYIFIVYVHNSVRSMYFEINNVKHYN